MAKREKKPVHKVMMIERKRNIIHRLLEEYHIQIKEVLSIHVSQNESAKY